MFLRYHDNLSPVTQLAKEAAEIVERLPREKAKALLEYARYLAEKVDDESWDRRVQDPRYSFKLRKMADQALE